MEEEIFTIQVYMPNDERGDGSEYLTISDEEGLQNGAKGYSLGASGVAP